MTESAEPATGEAARSARQGRTGVIDTRSRRTHIDVSTCGSALCCRHGVGAVARRVNQSAGGDDCVALCR
jgi:hypothetical protein